MYISCHMYIHHVDTLLHVVSSSKLFRDFVVNVLVVLYAFNEALRAYYHARTVLEIQPQLTTFSTYVPLEKTRGS